MPSLMDDLPQTLSQLLASRADAHPDRNFLFYGGRWSTYRELEYHARLIAAELARIGVQPGDHVVVMMGGSPLYMALWFAISKVGAVEVPVNGAYRGEVLRHILSTSRARLAFIAPEHRDVVDAVAGGLLDAGDIVDPHEARFAWDASRIPELAVLSWRIERTASDPACIIFTSGTTGLSKGVVVSHRHLVTFGAFFAEIVRFGADDTAYNFLPFFHVAAKFETLGAMLASGRMAMRAVFSLSSFWKDVQASGATLCVAVGGLCHMLFAALESADDADNPLRLIYAVPVPWEFKDRFEQRFGLRLVEAYGSTEANLPLYTRLDEETPRGSCGRASDHFEVSIRNEAGQEVAPGEPGEICIRGKYPGTMMTGYLGLPDKTAEAMFGGWFHSGDRATMNADGFVFFLDRTKDSIRRRGENISSFEVERLINAHPGVAEAAVIPVKADVGEDEVKAVVVLRPGISIAHRELLEFMVATMPYFMVPRFIEFRDRLPRTETMKVRKVDLRQDGVTPDTWDSLQAGLRITRRGLEVAQPPAQPAASADAGAP